MKKVIKKGLVISAVIGFLALAPAANAVTSPTQFTVHHYSCTTGTLDGSNCVTAEFPAAPAVSKCIAHFLLFYK